MAAAAAAAGARRLLSHRASSSSISALLRRGGPGVASHEPLLHPAALGAVASRLGFLRGMARRPGGDGYSPMRGGGGGGGGDCAPTEMAPLFPGCDYEHWLIVMDKPGGEGATKQQMIDCYIQTLAKVLGGEEEAKKKIYNVSCERYFGFGCEIDEETSNKLEGIPGVLFVLPDSYVDPEQKDYGGFRKEKNVAAKIGGTAGVAAASSMAAALRRIRLPRVRLGATFSYHSATSVSTPSADALNHVQDPNRRIAELAAAGRVFDARYLFDRTPDRDVVSWTALVAAYARHGMLHDASALFDRPDAHRNVFTWTALLSGYARARLVDEARSLFERMPERNLVSWNTMLEAYTCAGRMGDACALFNSMPVRDAGSWNILLAALVRSGIMDKARNLFERMTERNIMSWTTMVAGIARSGSVDEARALFDAMPERNVVSWNAMISGYAQNCRIDEALDLFMRIPMRDAASWNIMITGFIKNKDLKRAKELFDEMPKRNVITWTTMMNGCLQGNESETALQLFNAMLVDGIRPNQVTFMGAVDACTNLAGLSEGQQVHQMICKTSFQFDTFVESTLMNLYAKCGEIRLARNVFDLSREKDVISWNGMIAAYAHHGLGVEAIVLYDKMKENGYKPNDVTYVGLLSACSHSGLVDQGLRIFEYVAKDMSIAVRDEHYTCLIDLCSRAGRLDDAKRLIHGLKLKPKSSTVWSALLGGCNAHGNESIGDLAARHLLEAEPDNAGTYTLLCNIYASAGKWKEAAKIRSEMNDRGLKKQPGCSWIELANKVHVFVARDKSHSESGLINSMLQDIHHMMRMGGTVPTDHMQLTDEQLRWLASTCAQPRTI